MAPTTIHVKATSGSKITVPVELSVTVGELKTTLLRVSRVLARLRDEVQAITNMP